MAQGVAMSYHIISAQELAGKLKMCLKTMYKLLNAGQIPGSKKVGGLWYIDLNIFETSFSKSSAKPVERGGSSNRHNL